jgi:tetratricopeptide (TPR) repeat protein
VAAPPGPWGRCTLLGMLAVAIALAAVLGATPVSAPARAAFQRGEKALEAGRLDEAAAAYQEALRDSPKFAEALTGLGSVLYRQGKRAEAVATFQAAIAADPGLKLAHYNLGYAARKTGDFALAARAYQAYLQLDPTDADGYYGLGEAYRGLGRAEPALQAYQRYLSLENRPAEQPWVQRAKGYVAQLKAQLAAAAALPAPAASLGPAAVAPGAATSAAESAALLAEGDRALHAGNAAAAVQAYQSALQVDPTNVEALFNQGNALARLRDYRSAIEKWERVVQLSSDAGVRSAAQENVDKARARLAQAAATAADGGSRQSRAREAYERGVRLVLSRDYAAAVQVLTEALAADPTLAVAYTARGSANVGLRRFYEAAADYQDALRLDATRASPLYGLAEAYRALGRASDARLYYDRYAISTAPDAQPALQAAAVRTSAALAADVTPTPPAPAP